MSNTTRIDSISTKKKNEWIKDADTKSSAISVIKIELAILEQVVQSSIGYRIGQLLQTINWSTDWFEEDSRGDGTQLNEDICMLSIYICIFRNEGTFLRANDPKGGGEAEKGERRLVKEMRVKQREREMPGGM